jgi:hypothetical protein
MVDKKTLIDWLKKENVMIVSADVEGLPGLPVETVTIILTNSKPEHVLTGANRAVEIEPEETEAEKHRKEIARKQTEEGWSDK